MLTLPQRRAVVDDAIMVGSRTCERADRKSRFPMYYKTRGVTRIFAWGPCKPLLRVTQLIHELFHVALSPITWAARIATGQYLVLLHAQHAVHTLLLPWKINCPRDLREKRSMRRALRYSILNAGWVLVFRNHPRSLTRLPVSLCISAKVINVMTLLPHLTGKRYLEI